MIALVGEKEIWNGFSPLGVKVFEAETLQEIEHAIEQIKAQKDKFSFVLVSDEVASKIEPKLSGLYKEFSMVILPSILKENKHLKDEIYYKRLKQITEKAMGVDILG